MRGVQPRRLAHRHSELGQDGEDLGCPGQVRSGSGFRREGDTPSGTASLRGSDGALPSRRPQPCRASYEKPPNLTKIPSISSAVRSVPDRGESTIVNPWARPSYQGSALSYPARGGLREPVAGSMRRSSSP